MTTKPIRVVVVDDSAVARRVITESLSPFQDIEVVATAVDPFDAREKILSLNPDVLTLDIEMPRMDGLTFLGLIMKHRPMPVIVMSSLTTEGSEKAMEALQSGAVDVMSKPHGSFSAYQDGGPLADKIRAAAGASTSGLKQSLARSAASAVSRAGKPPAGSRRHFSPRQLILLGASTGGTEALKEVLTGLPADLPGICIVQHIPSPFSTAFAKRLNDLCAMEVREAKHGDEVRQGLALVAPGGQHILLKWTGSSYVVQLSQGPLVHHQRPAVDVLFDSAVKAGAGPHSVAGVLTGMGADGAAGLLALHNAGAQTLAQSQETCVVFGMPKEAIKLGGARYVLDLDKVAPALDKLVVKHYRVAPQAVA